MLSLLTTETWKYELHVSTHNTLTQMYEGKKVGAVIVNFTYKDLSFGAVTWNKHVTSEVTH